MAKSTVKRRIEKISSERMTQFALYDVERATNVLSSRSEALESEITSLAGEVNDLKDELVRIRDEMGHFLTTFKEQADKIIEAVEAATPD